VLNTGDRQERDHGRRFRNTLRAGQQTNIKVTGESVAIGTQRFALYAYNVQ
jgi:hypothetical protein